MGHRKKPQCLMSAAKKKKNVHSREKKNPQDNGDRLALIVFLNPIFWVLPVPRSLAQNMMGVANSVGLATPISQVTALKPFKSCSQLAYDGQTLEKNGLS